MNRVIAKHEIVRMFDRGAEDELRIFVGGECQNVFYLAKHNKLVGDVFVTDVQCATLNTYPNDVMTGRQRVVPLLSRRKLHEQIVDTRGCRYRAFDISIATQDNA